MREHIPNIQWETELAQDMDVDSCWNVIKNHLHRVRDKFIPKKKFSKSTKPKRNFKAPDSLLQSFKVKRESLFIYLYRVLRHLFNNQLGFIVSTCMEETTIQVNLNCPYFL